MPRPAKNPDDQPTRARKPPNAPTEPALGATQTALSGATLREIQARLGHASPAAALRYQHAAASRAAQVAEALGAAWVEPTQAPGTVRKIRRA